MKKIVLGVLMTIGFIMAISEGSVWCWANILGLMMFGGCGWKLGLFKQD